MSGADQTRRIAVIGGSGFIGRHLVERLHALGAPVRVIGSTPPARPLPGEWIHCDVRDTAGLTAALAGTNVAYNLVAIHGPDPRPAALYHEINVGGARSVCQAAAAAGVRHLIFSSSAAVYGTSVGCDETTTPTPRDAYGESKLFAEAVYREWASGQAGRVLSIVRPTVVFGVGGEGTAGRFFRHVAGPGFAHVGAAGNRRSLAFVDNVAAFLAFVMDLPGEFHLYNYADQPDLSVAEIVSTIREALNLPAAPRQSLAGACAATLAEAVRARLRGQRGPRFRTVRTVLQQLALDRRLDASRAHRCGFVPPTPLRDALQDTARADLGWVALLARARA